jgi:hypothetical protein
VGTQVSNGQINTFPLKLTIKIEKEKICLGKNIVFVSKLENTSNQDIIIDTRNVRRYQTDIAHNQYSNDLLKIPKMRAILGDNFEDEDVPKEFLLKLIPNQFYKSKFVIEPNKDNFFKTAGKYSIKIGYGQFKDWSSKGFNLFIGNIDSNELDFEVLDCKNKQN